MDKKRIAVFASGSGTNFKAILEKIKEGWIPAEISLLITDRRSAGAIDIADKHEIAYQTIIPKEFNNRDSFNETVLNSLLQYDITDIVLAGYLKLIGTNVVRRFENHILNIHPALLPSFGGKGMYGHYVHEAVFNAGVKVSGATVHIVNELYDQGPIVIQKCVDISDVKSPQEIAQKVLKIEHQIYPLAVKWLVENCLSLEGSRVIIKGAK